jgi:hypothetical protein
VRALVGLRDTRTLLERCAIKDEASEQVLEGWSASLPTSSTDKPVDIKTTPPRLQGISSEISAALCDSLQDREH